MTESQRDMWNRIDTFRLDDPDASLSFSRRLARENGWTHAFAQRVVEAYKRFVFLAMTAGHEVTPSDEVDQAWHLHLTYTRSYWDGLCGEVLGRPLHHGPTKGGKQEGERFEDQYERTLASYREAFGEEPPADIWPPSEARFGEAAGFVRVNRQRIWMIPKPRLRSRGFAAASLGFGLTTPVFGAGNGGVPVAVICLLVLLLVSVLCLVKGSDDPRATRRRRKQDDTGADHGFFLWGCGSGDSDDSGDSGCGASGCGGCGGCGGD